MIWWMALLFAAGMALILTEFILPGIILGVVGTALLCVCAVIGFMYYPEYAILIIVAEACGIAVSIGLGMFLMTKTNIGKSMRLEKSQSAEDGYINQQSDLSLVGKCGTAMSKLRPAGVIIVENKRIDAVSSGMMIDEGDAIRIIEVHGNRVVVEKSE